MTEKPLTEAEQRVFDALWEVAKDHRLEARTGSGSQYSVTGDIVRQMARAAVAARIAELEAQVEAVRMDTEQLIIDAYKRGFDWCRENFSDAYYLDKAACDYADKTLSARAGNMADIGVGGKEDLDHASGTSAEVPEKVTKPK